MINEKKFQIGDLCTWRRPSDKKIIPFIILVNQYHNPDIVLLHAHRLVKIDLNPSHPNIKITINYD